MIYYERSQPAATPDTSTNEAISIEPTRQRMVVGTALFWRLGVGVILALMVILLAGQNTGSINVSFFGRDYSTPLIVLILGAFVVGVAVAESLGLVYRNRRMG